MKRLFALLLFALPAFGQNNDGGLFVPQVTPVSSLPASCVTGYTPIWMLISTGAVYSCRGGVPTQLGGGIVTTPGGNPSNCQYNDAGAFGGDSGCTYGSGNMTLTGEINAVNGNFSGTVTAPTAVLQNVNGEIYASSSLTPSAVTPPAIAAGASSASSGGSVAANTYACEVTFIGAGGGETTPSPGSGGVTTSGGTSTLYCNANGANAGAVSFNVYWQTGGSGNFYSGHTGIALGQSDIQTTNPATSGTQPPASNTAVSIISAAQAALGGTGSMIVPNSISTSQGSMGEPSNNEIIYDDRLGAIAQQCTVGAVHAGLANSNASWCYILNGSVPQLTGNAGVIGMGVNLYQGFTAYGGQPFNNSKTENYTSSTALSVGNYRAGTNTNFMESINAFTAYYNHLAPTYAMEIDVDNETGVDDVQGSNNGAGISILNNSPNKVGYGAAIGSNFETGLFIANEGTGLYLASGNSVGINNQSTTELYSTLLLLGIGTPYGFGSAIQTENEIEHASVPTLDYYRFFPAGGTGNDPYTTYNFTHVPGGTGPNYYEFGDPVVGNSGFQVSTGTFVIPATAGQFQGSATGHPLMATGTPTVQGQAFCTDASLGATTTGCQTLPQAGIVTSASGTTITPHTFATAFTSTPVCTASPYTNTGAWYFSTPPSTTSSGVITYTTSGGQSFGEICAGVGGVW